LASLLQQKQSLMRTLASLKPGEKARIKGFVDHKASLKLMEMGCIPGEEVMVLRIAPLGDPMAIRIAGYTLSLRKKEASLIYLEEKEGNAD